MANIFSRKYWAEVIANRLENGKSGDIDLFLRIFNEYFFRFKKTYALIFILIAISAITTAGPVWLVEDVVNNVFVSGQRSLVIPLVFAIIAVFIIKGASTYWQTVLSSRISNAMVADVQKRMFDHILKQKSKFFSSNSSDELIMRFNQGAQGFNNILTIVLVNGSRDLATLLILLGTMIYYDWLLTLLSFTIVPLVFYCINILIQKIKEVTTMELAGLSVLNKHVREAVQGMVVVKSFNLEPPLKTQMEDVIEGVETRRNKIAALQAAPVPLLDTLGGVAVGMAILYAGYRATGSNYNSASFLAFTMALIFAAEHARRISQLPVKLKTAFVSVNMIFTLLNDDQSEEHGPKLLDIKASDGDKLNGAAAQPIIEFDDVSFSYNEEAPVLDGFSLKVKPGEMVALVGPSGAGKSTVLKLLLKLYEPTGGVIRIDGHDQNDLNITSMRDAMSFVGQSNFIFSGTIRDNLTLNDDAIEQERIEDACRAVGLHDYIVQMPEGYNTDVGELGSLISGGQAQRLNMARAIIKDSPILLLDEVTSALDAENEQLIKDYVQSQIGKKTILVIAHRLSTIKDATQIALIDRGKVIDVAPHEELLQNNDYYEKIVSLQFS